jgi:hypothetical protein
MTQYGVDRSGAAGGSGSAVTPIDLTIINAKGDLIAGTANDAAARLAVGADETVLVAEAAQPTGLKWALRALTGLIASSGITMATARLLGRTTASTGAVEEISVASTLTLSAGTLSATQASQTQAGVSEWATQAEVDAATASRVATTDLNSISLGTPTATTSGTSVDFTGIPSGTRRITLTLTGVSTNGTSPLQVQLGDSGGVETTGYACNAAGGNNAGALGSLGAASSSGWVLGSSNGAGSAWSGQLILTLANASTFTWVGSGCVCDASQSIFYFSGVKATSAVVDRIRLTTVNGTDTFDAGAVNITYER